MTGRVTVLSSNARWSFLCIVCKSNRNRNFITSHKRRQMGHMFICLFFSIFRLHTISSRCGSHKLRNTLYILNIPTNRITKGETRREKTQSLEYPRLIVTTFPPAVSIHARKSNGVEIGGRARALCGQGYIQREI